jgi:hypothetical protein
VSLGITLAIELYGDVAQIIAFSEAGAVKQEGTVSDEVRPILSLVARTSLGPVIAAITAVPR